ncbi:efflux RND transporter periplasmic adaptor subunit [Bisgaard Taxon 10/6]|uniref:efflux RND transporter periplasmic adaptor subunit n=1 Tax=Exercitatus varius TaxID=67857 RepID=UPI00294B2AB6|nr:efflux RND transporter periplasmic adaptor subunit [Exercitatus varius]MDG2947951.1 efflux RND transporter periplasmic adaptor subunit [Exercitatus varius]
MKKVLFVGLLSFLLIACQDQNAESTESSLMKVNVVQVQPAALMQTLRLSGSITAKEDVAVGTALLGLQIQTVNVEVGDTVKKGQILATLEASNVQSQLRQNDANLQRAKANLASQQSALTEAEATLKRYQTLMKSNAISRQELEQQQAKARAARAAVQAANAEIAQVQAQLDDSRHQRKKAEVLAPADGIITQRNAEVGNLTDNNALFHLARNGELEATVEASAEELSLLKTGLQTEVQVLDQTTSGQIRLLSSQIDQTSRTGKVRIQLQNPAQITLGTPALALIRLPEMRANTTLPLSAVNFNADGTAFVMMVNRNKQIERRPISLGEVNQGTAEILSGLKVGEQVLQKAGALMNEGDRVEVVVKE